MPPNERFRLYDHQSVSPIKPSCPEKQRQSGGISQALGPDVPFPVERQLFPEEQVLSNQAGSRAEGDLYESKRLSEEAVGGEEKVVKG
jgi:hypothetical protein